MAGEFSTSVTCGIMLSKRLYYGRGASPAPPVMSRSLSSTESYRPTGVMAYAVVPEPAAVDNPDVPSYQPYVHGRCDPPALIPLHMHEVSMEVDCCMDTAFVTVRGAWRVHCIMSSRRCDCRIAIPMGEQGSILGVEVDVSGRSYNSKWVTLADSKDTEKVARAGDGCFLTPHTYTFKIPQVDGGSNVSIKVSWSQKLSYQDGQFCLNVPFSFPAYVIPVGKKIPKREKIQLNVNSGTGTELVIKCTSHPLKELTREVRKLSFIYEAEVPAWSTSDLNFAYTVSSSDIFGGVLLQSPPLRDFDEREMFCFYLYPGNNQKTKVFRKEVVFVIDTSESMQGRPIESVKNALSALLSKLNPQDSFNIIAFNSEIHLFSSTMVLATHGSILNATHWLSNNLTADGGTNMMLPLKQAMKLLSDASDSIPLIFLITDGSVVDEREICNVMKGYLSSGGSVSPRICTFGIGLYCNHYFLQLLAQIGRGHYDCTYDADNIELRMERLFTAATSVVLANITMDMPGNLDSLELFPSYIPDLSFGSPLMVSGRYKGDFPDNIKVTGMLADMSTFVTDLKVQNAKDVPFDRMLTRRQIDIVTCHAWFSESQELEEKVAKISLQTSFPSEYTCLILLQTDSEKKVQESIRVQEIFKKINMPKKGDMNGQKLVFLGCMGVGFGNLTATAKNIPPGIEEPKSPEGAEILVRAASNCCSTLLDRCCCMCFIQACSYMNNQCSIVFTQLCTALACFECVNCCYELCACV
ncbi:PREDICTED: inter alpha-trypsin inhibitor, heavy chain 4 [Theobroma cacao]|uniref:Inter alpha-trypsin inhibitor, heavy chain 4 n=1 Tax=Theobroma cacao TaxID=3641 RepID=A0AB32WMV3_THECC|nr:PREDICTED: inter alpha-trypsin inhibitor, heavy chain 4 [Theobroma cacao]